MFKHETSLLIQPFPKMQLRVCTEQLEEMCLQFSVPWASAKLLEGLLKTLQGSCGKKSTIGLKYVSTWRKLQKNAWTGQPLEDVFTCFHRYFYRQSSCRNIQNVAIICFHGPIIYTLFSKRKKAIYVCFMTTLFQNSTSKYLDKHILLIYQMFSGDGIACLFSLLHLATRRACALVLSFLDYYTLIAPSFSRQFPCN